MVGRNDPCWCGSGKKYKKCHQPLEASGEVVRPARAIKRNPLVKTEEEIAGMRRAGAFNGELMDHLRQFVTAGTSTEEVNRRVEEFTRDHGHIPATLGYHGYPKSCCISRNNIVCHGIPSPQEILSEGDIVNVDITTIVDGFFGDQSETFLIGKVSPLAARLVEVTAKATMAAIAAVRPHATLAVIGDTIEPLAKAEGFSVVRSYTGHGIGREFHENITVLHHKSPDSKNVTLLPGMTFTIEPMINAGAFHVLTDKSDGWTVRTKDGSLSAQFEHTVLVTESGVDILNLTPSQKAAGVPLIYPWSTSNV